jgi:uncharacterized membrane protein
MLAVALVAFVGSHVLLSHPLRAPVVGQVGEKGFSLVYALVAFATLGWAANAFKEAPVGMPLWTAGDGLWAVATAIMFLASVLLAGSFQGNPALPTPVADTAARKPARGVFAITRHPMMWSFALWGLVHVLVSPRPAVIMLSAAMAVLALVGAALQDGKKAMMMGASWRDWAARTAFVPLTGQFSGKIGWGVAWPGPVALVGGTIIWLAATYAHGHMGAPLAGIWRWVS